MRCADTAQRLAPAFAALLDYPDADIVHRAETLRAQLALQHTAAARQMEPFCRALDERSTAELQDLYERAFDLNPVCIPYLSVHVFGEESFRRARLMTGLADAYRRAGFACAKELPDHLAVVLHFAASFDSDEWRDLTSCCLEPALRPMVAALRSCHSPYAALLEAFALVLAPGCNNASHPTTQPGVVPASEVGHV